ncbi:glycosyltransferase family 2 protein [Arcticibacter eurypsychrophilus]|uniref:glycosyltransferase family 2 protein n=1 Tax=Arcticibacter eurypsychrophilus TaxID=1434752 RepID=UPI00084D5A6A|nr:glycosyltransferase family 2 protein [Arcticibacter eurypsychrophilus]
MKKVSVITVNYNQPEVTETMLKSIFRLNKYANLEIIVVDNGSRDDPTPKWRQNHPSSITFIRSQINLGFAGGNNLAAAVATGDYLFFVNNDTEFTEGLIESLVYILDRNPKVGIISPKIKYFDDPSTIQYAGFSEMNYFTARNKCIGAFEKDAGQYDHLTGKTGFIHGAAMMITRSAIDAAGLMSEIFFLYYEEMDWCERIKAAQYEVWIEPKAVIYHKESMSVGKKSALKEYFMNRNRILFIRRNTTNFTKWIFYVYFSLLVFPRNMLKYYKEKRPDLASQFMEAIKWNIRNNKNSTVLGYPINDIK